MRSREEREAAAREYNKPVVIRKYTHRLVDRYHLSGEYTNQFREISLADVGRDVMAWPSLVVRL